MTRSRDQRSVGATEAIASWSESLQLDDVPVEALDRAKEAILDCVGVSLAGSTQPIGKMAAGFVRALGATEHCVVLGSGVRSSADQAAFANGVLAHALDFDDTWAPSGELQQETASHPTCTLVSVALPLGEMNNSSGAELLLAFLAGVELHGKLGFPGSTTVRSGFHGSSVFGVIGGAVTAAKLLKLDVDSTRMAIGVAAGSAAGINVNRGTMAKPYQVGNAAAAAVRASLMVRSGFTGALDSIEGVHGFSHAFMNQDKWNEATFIKSLGSPFSMLDPGVEPKRYAACYFTHRALDAMTQIAGKYDLRPSDIEGITVTATPNSIVNRSNPSTGLEAKFSLQYTMARAVIDRTVGFRSFDDSIVNDAETRDLMSRVSVYEDGSITSDYPRIDRPVKVRLRTGESFDDPVQIPGGAWSVPMTRDDIVAKYRQNAADVLGELDVERSIQAILELETLSSVAPLAAMLLGKPQSEQ